MKNLSLILFILACSFRLYAQTNFQENFESYQGFGTNLSGGWLSGPSGFKVYIRNFSGTNNKICETTLTNNHRKDSLITPDLNLLSDSAFLTFQSRIVDSYLGSTASFNHIPVAGDELKAFLSLNGNAFSQILDLLPSYPTGSSGLTMSNFSIPILGHAGSTAKVKFVATAKPNTEWLPSFDNFNLTNNTSTPVSGKLRRKDTSIQLIPNPASQKMTIQSSGFGQNATVEIFNILGNLVFSSPLVNGRSMADVSNFRPGIYMVKVSEGSRSAYERLVVKQ